jgi:hypothetical protein
MLKKIIYSALILIPLSVYAASTFTPNYNLEKPAAGDTGWADALNSNADEIDEQMFINSNTIVNHIADTVDAHDATAISSTPGALCNTSTDVQDFLTCLDTQVDVVTGGGAVTITTNQTITGQKTFNANTVFGAPVNFSTLSTGVCKLNGSGLISSSLLVDADVSASAAIAYSKLALSNSIVNNDISASAAIAYSKLSLANSIVNNDIGASAAIAGTKVSPNFGSQNVVTTGSITANGGSLRANNNLIIEDPGAGTNTTTIQSATLGSSYTITLPDTDGDANQVLLTNGSGVTSWTAINPVSSLFTTSQTLTIRPITFAHTVTSSLTLTLYECLSTTQDFVVHFKNSSATALIIGRTGASDTIDGATSATLELNNEALSVICDGTNWRIF